MRCSARDLSEHRRAPDGLDLPVPNPEGPESTWNGFHPKFGNHRLWVDAAGVWRVKNGQPNSDTDGTPLSTSGTQVVVVAAGEDPPAGTPAGTIIFEV